MQKFTFTIVGQSAVGKSKFCEYFRNCLPYELLELSDNYNINIEFMDITTKIDITDDKTIKTDGLILFLDITKPSTLNYLEEYLTKDCPKVLVGNKADLIKFTGQTQWYYNTVLEMLKNKQVDKYFDISAVSWYNIDKPFNSLLEILA